MSWSPNPAPVTLLLASGLGVVLALGLTGVMAYFDIDYSNRTSAYDSARVCAGTSDISACRYQAPAQVVSKSTDDRGDLVVRLSFQQLRGRTASAYVDKTDASRSGGLESGGTVNAELWLGEVTVLNGTQTLVNPDKLPNAGLLPVVVFGGATLVMAAWFVYSLKLTRRDYAAYRKSISLNTLPKPPGRM